MTNATSTKIIFRSDYRSVACFLAMVREEILPNTNRKTTVEDVLSEALKRYETKGMTEHVVAYLEELICINFNFK